MPDQLNKTIEQTFSKNIHYLNIEHPKVYEKLSALESALDLKHYKEKYELVFENNNFDVLELSSNTYLYNQETSRHTDIVTQSINHKKDENCFESFARESFSNDELNIYKNKTKLQHHFSAYAPIIQYTQDNTPKESLINNIHKFVFFGIGLGLHVESIHEKIKAKIYFIIEDDLELFRLSLFTTDYEKLSKGSKLIFSIFEDPEEFTSSSQTFLETDYHLAHYIKYFHLLSHNEDKISIFHKEISSQAHLGFFYNSLLTQYLKPLDYIFQSSKFITKDLSFNDELLNQEKFLLLAAGPSLQQNISWLKKHHSNFITVAVTATLPILELHNIVPDIIVNLDAFDGMNKQFDQIKSKDFFEQSICILSARTQENISLNFKNSHKFFFESGTKYKHSTLKPIAPCVGSLTYQLMLLLDTKNIYLLGLDLAIDKETGKTHLDLHTDSKVLKLENQDNNTLDYHTNLLALDGNFDDKVFSTFYFNDSRKMINYSTNHFSSDGQTIYNISNGVKFELVKPIGISDIPQHIKNDKVSKHIFTLLNKASSDSLTKEELTSLKRKLSHAKNLKKSLLKYSTISDLKEYQNILDLSTLQSNDYELNKVINVYTRYILSYIFDFFNNELIINKQQHLANIHDIFMLHLNDIIDIYLCEIQKAVK